MELIFHIWFGVLLLKLHSFLVEASLPYRPEVSTSFGANKAAMNRMSTKYHLPWKHSAIPPRKNGVSEHSFSEMAYRNILGRKGRPAWHIFASLMALQGFPFPLRLSSNEKKAQWSRDRLPTNQRAAVRQRGRKSFFRVKRVQSACITKETGKHNHSVPSNNESTTRSYYIRIFKETYLSRVPNHISYIISKVMKCSGADTDEQK